MAVTVASVIADARQILQDASSVRWTDAELIGYINDGQLATAVLKPTAFVKVSAVRLAAGTRQALPADGIQLLDIPRNMGAAGNTPGRVVTITGREELDAANPRWHATAPAVDVRHYMYDLEDPKHYMVYPPQPASSQGYVELVYGAVPPAAVSGGNLTIGDEYKAAIVDYVLSRAFSKDSEYTAGSNKHTLHRQAFIAAVTGKWQAEAATNPNRTAPAAPEK